MKRTWMRPLQLAVFCLLFSMSAVACTINIQTSSDEEGSSTTEQPSSNNSNNQAKGDEKHKDLILKTKELAEKGGVINSPFYVEKDHLEDVQDEYGEENSLSHYSKPTDGGVIDIYYYTYPSQNLDFGINKGSQICDIRSSDPSLQEIRLAEVESVLGKPDEVRKFENQAIYVYKVTNDIELKWVFSSNAKDAKVDHISVIYPDITINRMAG